MQYTEWISILKANAEEDFAAFQRKLIPTRQTILGVRTPVMRALAKRFSSEAESILAFPDEYYEVTFIKLTLVASMPFASFVKHVERCVAWIDNWASCDSFKAKSIAKEKDAFLPVLERIFTRGGEFYERYVLVTLLAFYTEEKYLPTLRSFVARANTGLYYVHTAVAWLVAEVLIKHYDAGLAILRSGILDDKTHDKAVQKATESYRLTKERKDYLRSLKK